MLASKILRPLYATGDKEERIFLQKGLSIEPFAFSKESKSQPNYRYCPILVSLIKNEVVKDVLEWFEYRG